jgi:hypothetical protein
MAGVVDFGGLWLNRTGLLASETAGDELAGMIYYLVGIDKAKLKGLLCREIN